MKTMNKIIKVLGSVAMFCLMCFVGFAGKHFAKQRSHWDYQPITSSQQIASSQPSIKQPENILPQVQAYAQSHKREMVAQFVQGARSLGFPQKIDEWTTFTGVNSAEISENIFNINQFYDLSIAPEQVDSVANEFQDNLLRNFFSQQCIKPSFSLFNQIDGITLYYRYFLGNHELFTMVVPSGSCQNHALAHVHYQPSPEYETAQRAKQEALVAMEQRNKQCRQIAKDKGYYAVFADYCAMEAKRDENSFDEQLAQLECDLSPQEIQNLAQETQNNFERKAERAADYVAFCRKEFLYWNKLNRRSN